MARGGYRPGSGRKKKIYDPVKIGEASAEQLVRVDKGLKPLAYMLQVMNDPEVDLARRDRMAIAAAPFIHPRKADSSVGRKEQMVEAAKEAGAGKFATPAAPKLVVSNP